MSPMPPNALDVSTVNEPTARDKQTVFVTGAAGFIGFHTSYALLERGDDVVGIDEMNDYYDVELKKQNIQTLQDTFGARFQFYTGDLCDEELVRRVVKDTQPGSMIHLAARAGVRPSIEDPMLYIHSNVQATAVLLEACRSANITKFVYASSSSVYGGSKNEVFRETDAVDWPVSPYAATKKSCELMAHTYHHLYNMTCTGLRFFTVYGPRGRPDMAPFKFMDRIVKGETIDRYGDGTSSRDYTYIDDIIQGVLLCHDKASGCEVFNLGNGTPVVLTDFIKTIEGLVGKEASVRVLPDQPGDVPRTCADVSKANKLVGYQPTTSLDEGLAKTWEWYRQTYLADEAPLGG